MKGRSGEIEGGRAKGRQNNTAAIKSSLSLVEKIIAFVKLPQLHRRSHLKDENKKKLHPKKEPNLKILFSKLEVGVLIF